MGDLRFIVEHYTVYCPDCGDEQDRTIVRMPGTRYATVIVCASCRARRRLRTVAPAVRAFLALLLLATTARAVSIPEDSPSPTPTPFTFYCRLCDPGPSRDRAGHNQVCLDCTNQDEPCAVTRDCVVPVITCASCVGSPHHLETCHGCAIGGKP